MTNATLAIFDGRIERVAVAGFRARPDVEAPAPGAEYVVLVFIVGPPLDAPVAEN